ncbi:MAG: NAD(P)/FAD-dependent oxidoreductase [Anaerolineae bacterium]|jgi:sarcosine oxidase subunit beta
MVRTITSDVAIIGGGIIGCATGYHLARRGYRVTIIDKQRVAAEGSGRSAGGVRAQCRDPRERRLAMFSIDLWQTLAEELDADLAYTRSGNLRLASSEARLAQLAAEGAEERHEGLEVELWDAATLYRHAPYLGPGFVGGKYCPTDGMADPVRTTTAFAWAAQRHGATLVPDSEVTEILVRGGQVYGLRLAQEIGEIELHAPLVLHAGGPWTQTLARLTGIEIPMRAVRLAIGATPPLPPIFSPFLSAHDLGIAARPTVNGQIHVSGFAHPTADFAKQITPTMLAELRAVEQMLPALAGVPLVYAWAGLLDVTPDEAPVIGPVAEAEGYWLAAGFSGHGFALGPGIGLLLAQWIADGSTELDLSAFRYDRFTPSQLAWQEVTASSVLAGKLDR